MDSYVFVLVYVHQCCCIYTQAHTCTYRSLWYSLAFVYVRRMFCNVNNNFFFYSRNENIYKYMFDGSCLGLSTRVFEREPKDKAFLLRFIFFFLCVNGKDIMETRQCTARHAQYATVILQPLERRLKTNTLYTESYQMVIMSFREIRFFFSFAFFYSVICKLYIEVTSSCYPIWSYRAACEEFTWFHLFQQHFLLIICNYGFYSSQPLH